MRYLPSIFSMVAPLYSIRSTAGVGGSIAVAAGGTVVESTRGNPGVELVFLTDPAGVRIEMMELPG